MKKLLIYIIILALVLVICLNLFLFYNNSSLSNVLNNSANTRNTIIELDKFKTNITEMSDAKESFILTGNSKYKENYETALNSAYNNADSLVDSNIISTEDKNTIVDLINDYDSINQSIFNSNITYPVSADMETLITNSSNAKLKVLHSVSNLIANHRDSLEKSSNSISKYIGSQKTFVSWISSIFTALMAIPPLLAKKFLKNSKDITNGINSIVQSDSTTTTSTDTSDSSPLLDSINALETFFNFQNNVEGIKEVRSQLIQNATLINYIRISSLNNSTINDKCQDCSNTLKSILDNLVEFEKLYSTNLSSNQLDIASYITKLKCSLNQLSSELSQLNEYNNYLLKLNNLLLNKETNN